MVRTKADNFYYKGYRDGAKLKVAMNNNLEMQAMGNGYDLFELAFHFRMTGAHFKQKDVVL